MRVLLKLLVVLAAVVATAWIGGEMLLARKAAAVIAASPQVSAAVVRPLREPHQIGIRVDDLGLRAPGGTVMLPWLEVWVPPGRPTQVNATLPPRAEALRDGRSVILTAKGGAVSLRFAPANGLALGAARIGAGAITVNGVPLAADVSARARLVGLGADAPRGVGAAYDVTAALSGVALTGLTGGAVRDVATAAGEARLWLDRAPARAGSAAMPRLLGLRVDAVEVRLGDLSARIRGRVVADAEGRAEGFLAIDTGQAEGFVARAAALGMLPRATVPLVTAMLGGVAASADGASAPAAAASARRAVAGANGGAGGIGALSPAPPEEIRIPVFFRDGSTWLGPVPVGPAPRFPR